MPYNADRRTNQAAVSAAATIRRPVDPGGICAYRKSDLQPEAGTQSYDQMKQMDRAREIHGKFGNQKDVVSSCRANRIGADPKVGIGRGLARLGCASLVAVVKPANLRYGNDGAAFWRVNGPRCRRVLGQRELRPGFVIIRQE